MLCPRCQTNPVPPHSVLGLCAVCRVRHNNDEARLNKRMRRQRGQHWKRGKRGRYYEVKTMGNTNIIAALQEKHKTAIDVLTDIITKLTAENAALRHRIRELESGGDLPPGAAGVVDSEGFRRVYPPHT